LSKQLLRSGTSIGANVSEAQKAQSISLKEANETYYWLRLLNKTDYLTENEFESVERDINEIIALLMAITNNTKNK